MTRRDRFPDPAPGPKSMAQRDRDGIERWGLAPRPWSDKTPRPGADAKREAPPKDLAPHTLHNIRKGFE